MRRHAAVALALASFASAGPAFAEGAAPEKESAALTKPHERRSGAVIGTFLGGGLAGSSGYPNAASKIDDPNYYTASGLMTGTGGSFFIMGALADYLNFGLWFGRATFTNGDWRSTGTGGGFRVEAFPLYGLVPGLRDLGLFGQFGIGATTLDLRTRPGVSSDGTESFIGAGAFYEWSLFKLLGGHVGLGPSLEYDVITSRSIARNSAMLGARLVFYGGM